MGNDEVTKGSEEWRVQRIQKAYCNPENYRRRNLAIKLAKTSGLKLAQVAMLYPLTKGEHISVIFGSSKPHHIDDMVALQHFNIDKRAMNLMEHGESKRFPQFPFVPQYIMEGRNNVQPIKRKLVNSSFVMKQEK